MHNRPSAYCDIPRTAFSDALSEYVSGLAFSLNAFGHQRSDPGAVCGNRVTGDFELIFVKGGKSLITVLGKEYECSAGDAVLIPPFTMHRIQTPADDPHDDYWMHFDVSPFHRHGSLIQRLFPNGGHRARAANTAGLLALYEALEDEMQRKEPGCMAYCNALLGQILLLLLRESGGAAEAPCEGGGAAPAEERIVCEGIRYIQEHITENIGVGDIASHLFVSVSALLKAFSSVLHSPPGHFIQLCKIKEAERLMNGTQLSVKEISQTLAFSSPYYFSSVFKKFFGVPPREYLRNPLPNPSPLKWEGKI